MGHLEKTGIQTRMLFAGNLIRHPCFDEMRKSDEGYRVVSNIQPVNSSTVLLPNTDRIMNQSFWVGVYPGMTEKMIDFVTSTIRGFVTR